MSIKIFVTYGDIGKKIQLLTTDGVSELKNKIEEEFSVSEPIDLFVLKDGNETPILDSTVMNNGMRIVAKNKPVINDSDEVEEEEVEEVVTRRPRSESISAPNYFLLPIKLINIDTNIITIVTSFSEIRERTHRNHKKYYDRIKVTYSSGYQTACTNWQMRCLGITNDESLQTMIDSKKKTNNACTDKDSLSVIKSYIGCSNVKIIKIDLIQLVNFLKKQSGTFAMPVDYRQKWTNPNEPGHSVILLKEDENMILYDPSASRNLWELQSEISIFDICRTLHIQDIVSIYATDECNSNSFTQNKVIGKKFGGRTKKSQKGYKIKKHRRSTKRGCRTIKSRRRSSRSRRHR